MFGVLELPRAVVKPTTVIYHMPLFLSPLRLQPAGCQPSPGLFAWGVIFAFVGVWLLVGHATPVWAEQRLEGGLALGVMRHAVGEESTYGPRAALQLHLGLGQHSWWKTSVFGSDTTASTKYASPTRPLPPAGTPQKVETNAKVNGAQMGLLGVFPASYGAWLLGGGISWVRYHLQYQRPTGFIPASQVGNVEGNSGGGYLEFGGEWALASTWAVRALFDLHVHQVRFVGGQDQRKTLRSGGFWSRW